MRKKGPAGPIVHAPSHTVQPQGDPCERGLYAARTKSDRHGEGAENVGVDGDNQQVRRSDNHLVR